MKLKLDTQADSDKRTKYVAMQYVMLHHKGLGQMWDEDILGEHSRFARFSREDNSTKGVMVLVHAA